MSKTTILTRDEKLEVEIYQAIGATGPIVWCDVRDAWGQLVACESFLTEEAAQRYASRVTGEWVAFNAA